MPAAAAAAEAGRIGEPARVVWVMSLHDDLPAVDYPPAGLCRSIGCRHHITPAPPRRWPSNQSERTISGGALKHFVDTSNVSPPTTTSTSSTLVASSTGTMTNSTASTITSKKTRRSFFSWRRKKNSLKVPNITITPSSVEDLMPECDIPDVPTPPAHLCASIGCTHKKPPVTGWEGLLKPPPPGGTRMRVSVSPVSQLTTHIPDHSLSWQ